MAKTQSVHILYSKFRETWKLEKSCRPSCYVIFIEEKGWALWIIIVIILRIRCSWNLYVHFHAPLYVFVVYQVRHAIVVKTARSNFASASAENKRAWFLLRDNIGRSSWKGEQVVFDHFRFIHQFYRTFYRLVTLPYERDGIVVKYNIIIEFG